MRLALALLLLLAAVPAQAAIARFALVMGANSGHGGEVQLRYATADAEKIRDVLLDLGGFAAEDTVLLLGPDAKQARRALLALNERVRQAKASPDTQVLLFVYYSGHADAQALHLGGDELAIDELERMVRGSAADFRLLVLDACRSGAATRGKGGTQGPAFAIGVDQALAGEGAVILTASAANEDAQESDLLKGSFFTHFLVSALEGAADVDGDGQVTLEEAYRYAYDATLRESSRSALGLQHPSFRYTLSGAGHIVLTQLAGQKARGSLVLPAGRAYLVLAGGAEGAVVGEVGREDAARELRLRPGRYFVRGRGPSDLREGTVSVAVGERRSLREDELGRVAYAQLVRKGGGELTLVHGPGGGSLFRAPLVSGDSWCLGVTAGWAVDLPGISLAGRVLACESRFANDLLSAATDELGLELRAARAWDLGRLTWDVGLSASVSLLHQRFDSMATAPDRSSTVPAVGVSSRLAWDLGSGWSVDLEATGSTYFVKRQATSIEAVFAPRLTLGLELRY